MLRSNLQSAPGIRPWTTEFVVGNHTKGQSDFSTVEGASVIERAPDRDHLRKPAQPVAGNFHVDLVYETNGHTVEIICHSEYQTLGIHDTPRTGPSRPSEQIVRVSHVPRTDTDIDFPPVN